MPRKLLIVFLLCCAACGSKTPVDMRLKPADAEVLEVPNACESLYDNRVLRVAVAEFVNMTTYQDAELTGTSSSRRSHAEAGVGITGVYAGSESYSTFESVAKHVAPQLGEFAQAAAESLLVNLGGVEVVSRAQLDKILDEQMFQMTVADPDTAVELGMLAGAEYIITGSVDNIHAEYTSRMSDLGDGMGGWAGVFLTLGSSAYNAAISGWTVETYITINMIDVSTGKIIATRRVSAEAAIGDSPAFTLDQIISGSKKAMSKAMQHGISRMSGQFEINTYINELRGGKKAALLNMGTLGGLKKGDKLTAMELSVQTDFRTGISRCIATPLELTLTVSEYIHDDYAWVEIDGSKKQRNKLRVGTLIKRLGK